MEFWRGLNLKNSELVPFTYENNNLQKNRPSDLLFLSILRTLDWYYITDVSVQFLSSIFKVSYSPRRLYDTLKMGPIGCTETPVRNYRSTLRNIPDERGSHLCRGKSLKLRTEQAFLVVYL